MASVGAPRRTLAQSGLGCPNGSTLPGRPIDRPLVCSGEESEERETLSPANGEGDANAIADREREEGKEGGRGREESTDRPTDRRP